MRPGPELVVLGGPSVAVADGLVLAVGAREEIAPLAGPDTTIHDLGAAHVRPGFRDAHCHFYLTGEARRRLDLHGLDLDGIRDAIAGRAEATPPGGWIEGNGFELSALGLDREPSAADLDDASPAHPVRLTSHDHHANWVNTEALRRAGWPGGGPSYFTEGEIRRFADDVGRMPVDERIAVVRDAAREFLFLGITEVQDHGMLADLEALVALARTEVLPMRILFSIRDHELAHYLAERDRFEPLPGRIEVNGQKMFLDGALGSRTAWTLEPYEDAGGTGHRALDFDTARERVGAAAAAGLPTFFHAIGDAAVRMALDLAEAFPGLPHRVEHAQLVDDEDLPRFARLGVAASLQPVHLLTDTPVLVPRWGEARARRSFRTRSLLETGADVVLGSDSPIETSDPMRSLFATTRRRTLAGEALPGDEAVRPEVALPLMSTAAAIEPGAPADLVALPLDPSSADDDALLEARPVLVVAAGRVILPA